MLLLLEDTWALARELGNMEASFLRAMMRKMKSSSPFARSVHLLCNAHDLVSLFLLLKNEITKLLN